MTTVARNPGDGTRATARPLTMLLRAVVILLSLQFVLGIWVNLFGTFPPTDNLGTALSYPGDPVLTSHYALAVVLVILGIVVVVVAFRPGVRTSLRWIVILGLLSIVWASASGVEFVLSGFSNNADSFSMAVAFIVTTGFYGVAQALVLPGGPSAGLPSRSATTPSLPAERNP
jgi:hypothetical protein